MSLEFYLRRLFGFKSRLEEEQLAMLPQLFGREKNGIRGKHLYWKSWNYNLYDLRSTVEASFLLS